MNIAFDIDGNARRKAYHRAWYQKNRDRVLAKRRLTPPNPNRREIQRRSDLKHRPKKLAKLYKVSAEEMVQWLKDKSCRICGSQDRIVIDHCHKSGTIRGRLCSRCNTGIGLFRERPDLLKEAASYLELSLWRP